MSVIAPLLLGSSAVFINRLKDKITGFSSDNTCKRRKDNILKQRTFEGLSKETQGLIQLITIENGVFPVGSFRYKAHRYPGDIDIFEPVKACCDKESASQAIANKISTMAKEISQHHDIYLGDFKAGLDERYNVSTVAELEQLLKTGLLTQEEYREAVSQKTQEDLQEFLRQFRIIRWSIPELIAGYKILPKKIKLSLADALTHKSVVKVDLWAPQNGTYNEITNFFLIVMIDKNGKETVLNEELGDRLKNLNHDIVKYGSCKHRNSLKLAKRLWNRALFLNETEMPKMLYPLFQSGANSLNQVAGESEVIRMMLEKLKNPPVEILLTQIDGFRRRITDVYDVDFNPEPMYKVIINILQRKTDIITGLLELENLLKKAVEVHSRDFLKCTLPDLNKIINDAKKLDKIMEKGGDKELEEIYE